VAVEADRISRGIRVQEIQKARGYGEEPKPNNAGFVVILNQTSAALGIDSEWTVSKLSKIRHGTQGMSIEDMTVMARLDDRHRGWTWVAYGLGVKPGGDAFAALAKEAKRDRGAG
jgi:hypothetical protein